MYSNWYWLLAIGNIGNIGNIYNSLEYFARGEAERIAVGAEERGRGIEACNGGITRGRIREPRRKDVREGGGRELLLEQLRHGTTLPGTFAWSTLRRILAAVRTALGDDIREAGEANACDEVS